ncbi:tRNA-uridine aminocarboxypropyltransferase [Spongorhabdus nitratireducens]
MTKRKCCARCTRPEAYCYCSGLEPVNTCARVVILQHPSEQKHPLNTARILALGLNNCQIIRGEDFTEHDELNALLEANRGNVWLLFPGEQACSPEDVRATSVASGNAPLVVVLDGTWRKASKIWHLSRNLQQLPKVALTDIAESAYRIRKAPAKGQLSTLEAVSTLLHELGQSSGSLQPMQQAFHRMIDLQIKAMGQDVFRRNYPQFAQEN